MSEVAINVNIEGVEQVTEGFRQIGDASSDTGRKVADSSKQTDAASDATLRYDASQKQLMMTTAGLIGNGVQLGDIMDRMAKGQVDVGRGALLLSMNFLQLGSQLYLLKTKYAEKIATQALSIAGDVKEAASGLASAIAGKIKVFVDLIARYGAKIATQTTSIALDIQEAASAAAGAVAEGVRTAAAWARTVAEKAKAVALAIANALEGPWGWAVLAGAAAAAGVGVALAAGIPSKAEGGWIRETRPFLLHEGEYVLSKETAREFEKLSERILSITTKETAINSSVLMSSLVERIPHFIEGGVAEKPIIALLGEREPEVILPLSRILNTTNNRVENNRPVNVYIQNPTFRSREDMDYMVKALRRGVE
jgi:hypothetical protein